MSLDRGLGESGSHLPQTSHLHLRWNFVLRENAQSWDMPVDELTQGPSQLRSCDQHFRPSSVPKSFHGMLERQMKFSAFMLAGRSQNLFLFIEARKTQVF